MEIKILVIGVKNYNERELKEVIFLIKEEFKLKKLPSSEEYLICCIPDHDITEIQEELEELSKNHSNPSWEIITKKVNNQSELEALPKILYYESK